MLAQTASQRGPILYKVPIDLYDFWNMQKKID